MRIRSILLASITAILATIFVSNAAFAFCGVLQASATGYSREDALNKANNKGLVEVRKLERSFGAGNVHYNPASSSCQEGYRVTCNITQRFCTDGGGRPRPSRGEEGGGVHGCPPGTKPVPETDNCVPVRGRHSEFEREPWKKPGCRSWQQRCNAGDGRACAKYESTCQVN